VWPCGTELVENLIEPLFELAVGKSNLLRSPLPFQESRKLIDWDRTLMGVRHV
jgi:hypothetical protein